MRPDTTNYSLDATTTNYSGGAHTGQSEVQSGANKFPDPGPYDGDPIPGIANKLDADAATAEDTQSATRSPPAAAGRDLSRDAAAAAGKGMKNKFYRGATTRTMAMRMFLLYAKVASKAEWSSSSSESRPHQVLNTNSSAEYEFSSC